MDARGAADHRPRLVAAAHGAAVEIGAGYGATFPFYPAAVTGVLAIEPDPTLREPALVAAGRAPVPVTVDDGVAESLPAADASVDVVSSLVLCSVADQSAVLAEIVRVLRPGGEALLYDARFVTYSDRELRRFTKGAGLDNRTIVREVLPWGRVRPWALVTMR